MTVWNSGFETSPANSDAANQGAAKIRELKTAISERLELEMNFKAGTQPLLKAGVASVCFSGNTADVAAVANSSNGALAFDTSSKQLKRRGAASWELLDLDHGAFSGLADDDHPQYLHLNKANQTILANISASPGITIDGRDISSDGATLDTLYNQSIGGSIYPAEVYVTTHLVATGAVYIYSSSVHMSSNSSSVVGNLASTCSSANTGLNGLDTGSWSANNWYYLWAISNGATHGTLLSASNTAPTLPSGYTFKRLICPVRSIPGWIIKPFSYAGGKVYYLGDHLITTLAGNNSQVLNLSTLVATPVYEIEFTVVAKNANIVLLSSYQANIASYGSKLIYNTSGMSSNDTVTRSIPVGNEAYVNLSITGNSSTYCLLYLNGYKFAMR